MRGVLTLVLMSTGLAACKESVPVTNATEDARISRSMEDVAAGQVQSEADVAKIEAARRQDAKTVKETARNK